MVAISTVDEGAHIEKVASIRNAGNQEAGWCVIQHFPQALDLFIVGDIDKWNRRRRMWREGQKLG